MNKYILGLILSFFLVNSLLWSVVIPYNQAPDEYSHFDVTRFLAENKRFPIFGKDKNMGVSKYEVPGVVLKYNASYSSMPPFSYLFQAGFLFFDSQKNYLTARLANIVLGMLSIFIAYRLGKKLFAKDFQVITFSILAGFSPQVVFTSAYVNSDMGLLLFSFLFWLWIAYFLKKRPTWYTSLYFGITLGLGVLTRYNILPMIIISFLVYLFSLFKNSSNLSVRYLSLNIALSFVASGAMSIWWYLRNLILYKDLLGSKQFWQTYWMIYPHQDNRSFLSVLINGSWWWKSWQSLWGVFDWNIILWPDYIYRLILLISFLLILGLILSWKKIIKKQKDLIILAIISIIIVLFLSIWQSAAYSFQPQGRYLFAAWPGLIFILLSGLYTNTAFNKSYWPRLISFFLVIFIIGLNLYSLLAILIPAYY